MPEETPIKLCLCGCGREIPVDSRRTLYDPALCRPKWRLRQVTRGEVPPKSWGTCKTCGKPFPRFGNLPYTMRKKFCHRSCAAEARAAEAAARREGEGGGLSQAEWSRRRLLADQRSETCFSGPGRQPCTKYGNWLEEPEFFCECTGYEAGVPENIMKRETA